jgi:hypothetical protein
MHLRNVLASFSGIQESRVVILVSMPVGEPRRFPSSRDDQ